MMQHPTPLSARPADGRIAALAAAMLVVLPLTGLAQEPTNLHTISRRIRTRSPWRPRCSRRGPK